MFVEAGAPEDGADARPEARAPEAPADHLDLAHAAVAAGATSVMPGPDLSGKALADLIF